jgi:YHS domain-containing protein
LEAGIKRATPVAPRRANTLSKEGNTMLRSQYFRLVVSLLTLALSIGLATSALGESSKTPVAPVNAAEGIGVKGYDPVAYFVNEQPTKGAKQYAFVWKGVTYRFSSGENLTLFKAAPTKYLPQYGGYCAYAMSLNRIADISPSEWAIVDGKLYLNNGVFSQSLWSLNKSGNIASADRHWPQNPKKPVGE